MMKVFCPSNGKKIEVKLEGIRKFFWANCENPSNIELKRLEKKTKINSGDLKIYINSKKDSKLIFRKNYDIILLRYPVREKGKVLLHTFEIIFNKKFVITLYDKEVKTLTDLTKNIKEELVGIKRKDYLYFLQRVLAALSKEFMLTLDEVEIKIDKVEDDILKQKYNIKNLSLVRKGLLYIRKALVKNRNVIVDLQEGMSKYLVPNMLTHVYTDITQILDTEELFRDRLTNTLDLHLSLLSNKMNNAMKSFTVVASLLLIPMLVSSIYGMNVGLPLQEHPNAFYTIILLILLSVIITLLYFKSKKWI